MSLFVLIGSFQFRKFFVFVSEIEWSSEYLISFSDEICKICKHLKIHMHVYNGGW